MNEQDEATARGLWPAMASSQSDLHDSAMELADEARGLRKQGRHEAADAKYAAACDLEARAAAMTPVGVEPTRSVLHRSAAWLAYHAGQYQRTIALAKAGLEGAPWEITLELQEVLEAAEQEAGKQ